MGGTGRPARRIAGCDAEARCEAVEAQDAQMVFPDAFRRIADEADAGRIEIGEATEIVEHRPVRAQRQRVHRKVAAQRILAPVRGEGDGGAAPVGFDVPAAGR